MFRYIVLEGRQLDTKEERVPVNVTNAVSWRADSIYHRKNEVFLDVIEYLDVLVRLRNADTPRNVTSGSHKLEHANPYPNLIYKLLACYI